MPGRRVPCCVTKWIDSNRNPSPLSLFRTSSIAWSDTSDSSTTRYGGFSGGSRDTASPSQRFRRIFCGVRDDEVRAGPLDGDEDLHHRAIPVHPAELRGRLDHGILPADVVGGHGKVERLPDPVDDVQV